MPTPIDVLTLKSTAELPLRCRKLRIGVVDHAGLRSISWKVEVNPKGDVYIIAREHLQAVKVSLHVSDIWKLGFTQKAVRNRPSLVPDGQDRAWEKWSPPEGHDSNPVVALKIAFPPESMHLGQEEWQTREPDVLIMAPRDGRQMVLLHFFVVPGESDLMVLGDVTGGLVAVMALPDGRTVQVAASYAPADDLMRMIDDVWDTAPYKLIEGVDLRSGQYAGLLIHGAQRDGTRYLASVYRPVP